MKRILNNKGMTLVEIILSIGLVSIVMVQVLNILVDLKDEQLLGKDKTKDLTNRSVIMKTVQEDFMNKSIYRIYKCPTKPTLSNYKINSCITIKYNVSNGATEDYYMMTATSKKTDDDNEYFIYGQLTGNKYEAWPLTAGTYPKAVDTAHSTKCGFLFQKDNCDTNSEGCANARYFRIYYPVKLNIVNENTSMNFDLEFMYYFRSTSTNNNLYKESDSPTYDIFKCSNVS